MFELSYFEFLNSDFCFSIKSSYEAKLATNCTEVTWNSSEKGINITIKGRWVGRASDEEGISEKLSFSIIIILFFFSGDWISAGLQTQSGTMKGSDLYICKRLGPDIKLISAYGDRNGAPVE